MNNVEFEEMLIWINNQLANGKTKDDIVKQLLSEDTTAESINKMIDAAIQYKTMKAKENNSGGGIPPFIMSILSLIIMFGVLNGVIYGGQEIYYWNDVKKCELMEVELKDLEIEVNKIEDFINFRKTKVDRINQLEKEIKQGLSKDYTKYKQMIDEYNSNMSRYKKSMDEYDNLIVKYNKITREYNDLAKSAYSRWWLLPIPLPSKHVNF